MMDDATRDAVRAAGAEAARAGAAARESLLSMAPAVEAAAQGLAGFGRAFEGVRPRQLPDLGGLRITVSDAVPAGSMMLVSRLPDDAEAGFVVNGVRVDAVRVDGVGDDRP